ncbi:MAG: hypothetical protein RL885_18970 [Planctomycetota bacterium]
MSVWICLWVVLGGAPGLAPRLQEPDLPVDLRGALASYFKKASLPQNRKGRDESFGSIEASFRRYAFEVGAGSIQGLLRDPDKISTVVQSWPYWDQTPSGGHLFEDTYIRNGEEWSYYLHLPTRYRAGVDRPPLIVDLWGGEDPLAYFQEFWEGDPLLEEVVLLLPPKFSGQKLIPAPLQWQTFAFDGLHWVMQDLTIPVSLWSTTLLGVPMVSTRYLPLRLPTISEWSGPDWEPLEAISQFFWDRFSVDEERIFLSARGELAPDAARLAAQYKDFFAGLILFNGPVVETHFAPNLERMGIYAPEGCPLVEAVEKRGGRVSRGGDLSHWIAETRVELYPDAFEVVVPHPSWGDAWWVKVYDMEPVREAKLTSARVPEDLPGLRVELDRSRNAVILEQRRVRVLRVRLNDTMLDLSRPVRVLLRDGSSRGQERTLAAATVMRSLPFALENVFLFGERRRIFVNDLWVFIP